MQRVGTHSVGDLRVIATAIDLPEGGFAVQFQIDRPAPGGVGLAEVVHAPKTLSDVYSHASAAIAAGLQWGAMLIQTGQV